MQLVLPVYQAAHDLGSLIDARRTRARELREKNHSTQMIAARRLKAYKSNQTRPPQRVTMVSEEIKKWHRNELRESLMLERTNFYEIQQDMNFNRSEMNFKAKQYDQNQKTIQEETKLIESSHERHTDDSDFDPGEQHECTEWDTHIAGQVTRPTLSDPAKSALGSLLRELGDFNSRPFSILDEEKASLLLQEKTSQVSVALGVSQDLAHGILVKNKWDVEFVVQKSDQDSLLELLKHYRQESEICQQSGQFVCPCCYCECDSHEVVEMPDCGHQLCSDCFWAYLQEKVQAGVEVVSALCPDQSCSLIVPPRFFKDLLNEQEYQRYYKMLLKTFIEQSINIKWCIGKSCDLACRAMKNEVYDVQCECESNFCFSCQKPAHAPLPCSLLASWLRDVDNQETATEKWLRGNTKLNPKSIILWNIQSGQESNLKVPFKKARQWTWCSRGKKLLGAKYFHRNQQLAMVGIVASKAKPMNRTRNFLSLHFFNFSESNLERLSILSYLPWSAVITFQLNFQNPLPSNNNQKFIQITNLHFLFACFMSKLQSTHPEE